MVKQLTLEDIKHEPDGTPFVRPYLGTSQVTHKRIRPYRSFPGMSDSEALEAAQAWVNTMATASRLHVRQSMAELLERYLDQLIGKKAPNTIKTYRSAKRCYVDPYIGDMAPDEVDELAIEALYAVLAVKGARSGDGIDARTIVKVHHFLTGAWRWLCSNKVASSNPLLSVEPPEPISKEAISYTEAEYERLQRAILKAIAAPAESPEAVFRRNAMFAAHLALNTGMRCGETCALLRMDARLESQSIHICANVIEVSGPPQRVQKTKGKRSRNATIDELLCDDIRAHYMWQRSYLTHEDERSITVCTTSEGGLLRPSKVSEVYSEMRDRMGLPPDSSFHSLRHTHATMLLLDGVDLRDIQDRLGHKDGATTLRLYAHRLPGRDRAAADRIARRRAAAARALSS